MLSSESGPGSVEWMRRGAASWWPSTSPIAMCSAAVMPIAGGIASSARGAPNSRFAESGELVEAVERRSLVAFRQGRVVKDGIDEVIHGSAENHDGLADVQQLGGALADDVDAQHLLRFAMEDDLQASGGVAADLAAGDLSIKSHADLVRNVFVGKLLLGLADERNFGDGEDAVRIAGRVGVQVLAEGVRGGDAALLHGDRGQARKADDVACGEDVGLLGAVFVVDRDSAARVGFEAGRGEVQVVHVALTSDRVEQRVAGHTFFAGQVGNDAATRHLFHALNFLVEAQGHAIVSQMVGERFHHFAVGEVQQAETFFDQDDAHAERGEHASVFDTDHAASDHQERSRDIGHFKDMIAVDDRAAVQRHFRAAGRASSGGDDDGVGGSGLRAAGTIHLQRMRVNEFGRAADQLNVVARQLALDDIDLSLDHVLDAQRQVGHRDLVLNAVVYAVDILVVVAGEVKDSFAEGFAGDGAGIDADAAQNFAALDDGDALAHFGALNRRALPSRAGSNYDQVIALHVQLI